MPRIAQKHPARRQPAAAVSVATETDFGWLTLVALVLSAAIVIARLLMLESARSALRAAMNAPSIPLGPGPTAGLVLDLFACIPALLVLARRWLDPSFSLRWNWSHLPMALLGLWAVLSPVWAADRFAATVNACHLLAALILLWSTAQVVTGWLHVRLLAGLCFGLLLAMLSQAAVQRLIDQPDLEQNWARERDDILRQRGFAPGSFEAGQFENKILHGELMGFSASPNTHAAVLVLLIAASVGIVFSYLPIRRRIAGASPSVTSAAADDVANAVLEYEGGRSEEEFESEASLRRWFTPAIVAVAILISLYVVSLTQSRTAYVTLFLAALLLSAIAAFRHALSAWAGPLFWLAVSLISVGTAALVGHGMRHGTLFHDSLNFRWRYWVGAYRVFRQHPLIGVGWDNFAQPYLGVRLPTATEEIKDPHNFVVRLFAELGAVGGVLGLAWLLRLWWEMTRPTAPTIRGNDGDTAPTDGTHLRFRPAAPDPRNVIAISLLVGTAVLGIAINALSSIDLTQNGAFIIFELMRRTVYLVALLAGWTIVCLRRADGPAAALSLDDRPGPWMLYGLLVGLGLFLLHNVIDFGLFEPGPMSLFAMIVGVVLGVRFVPKIQTDSTPLPELKRRRLALAGLCLSAVAWLAAAGLIVSPVATAESHAQDADRALSSGQAMVAAKLLTEARSIVPSNADYAFRAAEAFTAARQLDAAIESIDAAIAASPFLPGYRGFRAELELERANPDRALAKASYERAVALDPNNVALRIRFADTLAGKLRLPREAANQYERALWFDDQLTREEKKRLSAEKVKDLRKRILELRSSGSTARGT